jgi:hypothetical protein
MTAMLVTPMPRMPDYSWDGPMLFPANFGDSEPTFALTKTFSSNLLVMALE